MAFCGPYISELSLDSLKVMKGSLSCKIERNNPSINCVLVANQMAFYCETGSRMEKLEED
jgi:hypothetical protein